MQNKTPCFYAVVCMCASVCIWEIEWNVKKQTLEPMQSMQSENSLCDIVCKQRQTDWMFVVLFKCDTWTVWMTLENVRSYRKKKRIKVDGKSERRTTVSGRWKEAMTMTSTHWNIDQQLHLYVFCSELFCKTPHALNSTSRKHTSTIKLYFGDFRIIVGTKLQLWNIHRTFYVYKF